MRVLSKLAMLVVMLIIFFTVSPSFFVAEAASTVSSGSMIGGVSLEGLSYDEAREKLLVEVELWQKEADLLANYDNGSISIPRDIFRFDIDGSLAELKQQTQQPWYLFFLKDKSAQLPFIVDVSEERKQSIESPNYVDLEATLLQAQTVASFLGKAEVAVVYKEDRIIVQEAVATVEVPIPNTYVALDRLVAELNGQTIEANSQFSFLKSVVAPIETSQSGKEMNFVASAFYALLLQSNIEILERHSQGEIPRYLEPGIEVKVSQYEKKDFIIYNHNHYSYTVNADISDETLNLSLHSVTSDLKYEYRVENKIEIEPRTIYRYSKDLRPRQQKTIDLGEKGLRVDIYRLSFSNNGNMRKKELVSRDFYPPSPKVVLLSTIEPPVEMDVNPNTNGEVDDGFEADPYNNDMKGYEIIDLEEEEFE